MGYEENQSNVRRQRLMEVGVVILGGDSQMPLTTGDTQQRP